MSEFSGFPKATLTFLRKLQRNNDREWFQENKSLYEKIWLAPSLAFIEAMEKPLEKFSPCFRAVAKKSGGSLMRIYRDTRFAKDKTPYKTNIGIQFRHEMGSDVHAPGLYVHIEPNQVFLGAGVWRPATASARKIREHIDERQDEWRKATRGKAFTRLFELAGESLKRPPAGFSPDHLYLDDLKRKDFIAVRNLEVADIHGPDFAKSTLAAFMKTKPLVSFLCDALSVPF